jgi:predicted nucleic acid-binding protein
MRTAIDTNVLSALWSKELSASDIARNLGNAKAEGGLVVSGPVFPELLAYPKATESFVNDFLADTGIAVDFEFQQLVWVEAGRRFCALCETATKVRASGTEVFAG